MDEESFRLNPYLQVLRVRLEKLPESHRIAFAAAACERLSPFYEITAKSIETWDKDFFRDFLNKLWGHISGKPLEEEDVNRLKKRLLVLDLGENDEYEFKEFFNETIEALDALLMTLDAVWEDSLFYSPFAGNKAKSTIIFRYARNVLLEQGLDDSLESIARHPLSVRETEFHNFVFNYLESRETLTQADIGHLRQMVNDPQYGLLKIFKEEQA